MFENEYLMNRNLYKEYVYNVHAKRILILGFITVILGLPLHFFVRNYMSAFIAIIAIVAGIVSIITPIVIVKEFEKVGKSLNNGVQAKTNIKFLDNIVMNEGTVHLEMEYHQIQKVVQTPNFIVLKLSARNAILVAKDGFVQGTKEDFLKFIEEKRLGKC